MIITLLTDFGTADPFVAGIKGVILSINPRATIVDITHEIPPHEIRQAAYVLKSAYRYFPKKTIHIVVVDPGVGGPRKPLLVVNPRGRFLAPDNGVLSYIYREHASSQVYHLIAKRYRLRAYSPTFDGRDLFAPAAAWLSKGVKPAQLGRKITEYVKFSIPEPRQQKDGSLQGQVIHIDRFGNLITNITVDDLQPWLGTGKTPTIIIKDHTVKGLRQFYGEAGPGELCALINSDDHLELFHGRSSAQLRLNAMFNEKITVY
jgi:S-adenosylmethionine hydrolase